MAIIFSSNLLSCQPLQFHVSKDAPFPCQSSCTHMRVVVSLFTVGRLSSLIVCCSRPSSFLPCTQETVNSASSDLQPFEQTHLKICAKSSFLSSSSQLSSHRCAFASSPCARSVSSSPQSAGSNPSVSPQFITGISSSRRLRSVGA